MTEIRQIEAFCKTVAPYELADDWDNVGLLVGAENDAVDKVFLALDITPQAIEEAREIGAGLIVSHHPLLFSADNLSDETADGALLLYLAQNDIAVISLHTNLDSAPGGVNDVLARRLDLEEIRTFDGGDHGIGRIGTVPEQSLGAFARFVRERLGADGVRYADGGRPVHRVAVGGGSCMDFLPQALEAGCDTFVTGDIKYHQFQKAAKLGVNLIDAGHFPTEDPVCTVLCDYLSGKCPEIEVKKSEVHSDCVKFA